MSNRRIFVLALLLIVAVLVTLGVAAATPSAPAPTVRLAGASAKNTPDLAVWMVRPCPTEDSVNCRHIATRPNGHTFSVRALPGRAKMVCVFYAERRYAATHDYCTATR